MFKNGHLTYDSVTFLSSSRLLGLKTSLVVAKKSRAKTREPRAHWHELGHVTARELLAKLKKVRVRSDGAGLHASSFSYNTNSFSSILNFSVLKSR